MTNYQMVTQFRIEINGTRVMFDIATAMNLLPSVKSNFELKPFTLYFKLK